MGRLRFLLGLALPLVAVGLIALSAAGSATATDEYRQALDQPCIACHTTGVSPDLNARGSAFAAVSDHRASPRTAWETAVQAVPLQPSTDSGASVLVPIAVLVLLAAWAFTMLRRRRSRI